MTTRKILIDLKIRFWIYFQFIHTPYSFLHSIHLIHIFSVVPTFDRCSNSVINTTRFHTVETTLKRVIRQPPEFCLNDEDQGFTTSWYAHFANFAKVMYIPDEDQYVTISSYLDTTAFTAVENLKLDDDTKVDPKLF